MLLGILREKHKRHLKYIKYNANVQLWEIHVDGARYLEDALNPLKRRHHHKQRGARVDRSELPIHNACMPPRMMIGP